MKQNRGVTIGKMSWITVGVTNRQRCDAHLSRSNEGSTVADGAALGHIARESNSRFPCHHRFEKFLKLRQGRNSVEHDTSAHDVENLFIKREHACALQHVGLIIAGNFGPKFFHVLSKSQELITRVLRILVRNRKMCRDAVDFDVWKY